MTRFLRRLIIMYRIFTKYGMVSNTVSRKEKTSKRHLFFVGVLKNIEEKRMFRLRICNPVSRYEVTDPYQNVKDPEHSSSASFPDPVHH